MQKLFLPFDSENDRLSRNCAIAHFRAWCFPGGYKSHLDELYYLTGKMSPDIKGTKIPEFAGIH